MRAGTLIPVEEYLASSYKPEREYKDGVLVEKAMPKKSHARLQYMLAIYFGQREKQWGLRGYTELRIKLREGRYVVPDLCLYQLPEPEGEIPDRPPFLWIEIMSESDAWTDVIEKANEAIAFGVPYYWIIDPDTLVSELRTQTAVLAIMDQTLRIPESRIIVPLREVLEG